MLPALSEDEERHSQAAATTIGRRLAAAGGWLSFEEFMDMALYAPGLGYYSAGSAKLGKAGDFVTAPEISDLFSQCVARQCAEVLAQSGGRILELGAGTGRMAAVILETLAELGQLPEQYAILEVGADLADRQRTRIQQLPADLRDRVVWLDRLPVDMDGVILANEVLDALPFKRFVMRGGHPHELGVGLIEGQFAWQEKATGKPGIAAGTTDNDAARSGTHLATADSELEPLIHELGVPLADGYRSEASPRVGPWIAGVGQCLRRGLLLLFDYGLPRAHYYHPQRSDGTLRCYFKHRAHDDPFVNIGVQDITAWVDFTRVAEAAVAADLEVAGFTTQAAFLLGTGIEELAAHARDETERARLAGEARRLLMPGEMGEAFKVMALRRTLEQPLRGFAYQDLRRSL
jgi:SAM-dependent MidA family methyltransferase